MSEESLKPAAEAPRPRRSWRLLAVGLPLLLAGFAANHVEHACRQRRLKAAADAGSLVVRAESSSSGHSQIGIDEAALAGSRERPLLRFATLGEWAYDPRKPAACPAAISALSGREAACVGFMYPLEAGTRLRLFCLLRTTQTCCYGPRPQYNQYLFVELKAPVKFERFAPVTVTGRFVVDPQPEQGYIYRMEGTSVAPAAAEDPETDGARAALDAKLPLFDFAVLAAMQKQKPSGAVPDALLALDGKSVVMEGYILTREEGSVPRLLLARDWWDGKVQGRPPSAYSAAKIALKDSGQLPPAWRQKGVFMGTLRVAQDAASWPTEGIVSLHDARRAGNGGGRRSLRMDPGLILPVPYEVGMLALFLFLAFRAARLKQARGTAGQGK